MSTANVDPEFARARSEIYDLLSRVFDGDVEVLKAAVEADAFDELAAVLPGDFETAAISGADLDEEALRVGYDNLFAVPGPYYVPPFASAHVEEPSESFESDSPYHDAGEAGELLGESAESFAALYSRTGFTPERGDGIPDHIAAEFEFMATLANGEARLPEADVQGSTRTDLQSVQQQVVDHLEWIDAFAASVERSDSAEGIYAAVCAFTSGFVAWDQLQFDASSV